MLQADGIRRRRSMPSAQAIENGPIASCVWWAMRGRLHSLAQTFAAMRQLPPVEWTVGEHGLPTIPAQRAIPAAADVERSAKRKADLDRPAGKASAEIELLRRRDRLR